MATADQTRTRARTPKTKTGCKTCKIRRVKCDEGKPTCTRCLKFGVDCDGYGPKSPGSNSRARPPVKDVSTSTRHSVSFLILSPREVLFNPVFQDDREYHYFLHYQEEAAIELASAFDTSLWNRLIPQACQSEPSICRLTAAIGALNKANNLRSLYQLEDSSKHQQYALRQYGRALKGIQEMISASRGPASARTALIAALLIFCFENLQGDLDCAIVHMESALRLMRKQFLSAGRAWRHLQNISPIPDLEADLVAAFVRADHALLSAPKKGRPSGDSPHPKGSLIVRLSILDLSFSDNVYDVPNRFKSITEARLYLELAQFRALPSLAHEFTLQIDESPGSIDEIAKSIYRTTTSQLHEWQAAFAPLYAESGTSSDRKTFVTATSLRVHALCTEVAAQRMCVRGMTESGVCLTESREILSLSKLVVADSSFRKSFVFDCGIIPGLFIVVIVCSEMSLRREALQILRDIRPRIEGAWDSTELVKVGERALQMEVEKRTWAPEQDPKHLSASLLP